MTTDWNKMAHRIGIMISSGKIGQCDLFRELHQAYNNREIDHDGIKKAVVAFLLGYRGNDANVNIDTPIVRTTTAKIIKGVY